MTPHAILFVLESFLPDHRAGTEIYVLNLCRYFKAKGWRVGVLIATINQQKDYSYEGIPVYTFPIPEKPNSRELNGLMPPRGIEDFMERIEDLKPDLVHFHSFGRAINGHHLKRTKELGHITAFTPHLASLFCIKGNMRLFDKTNCNGRVIQSRCMSCLLHSKGYDYTVSKALGSGLSAAMKIEFLEKAMAPSWHQAKHRSEELQRISTYADVIFAIAPWVQKAFNENRITNSILVPQGISPVFFEDLNRQESFNPSAINFVFIGRMHPIKGFHFLKEAWDKLQTKGHKLHIITNPSRDENEYFHTNKLWATQEHSIIWNEGFSQQKVASYLDAMDVLILPSISEVAPLVMLEAATRRIPVIASDFIGVKDLIVPNVTGLLFKNGDWEDLLLQLNKISDKPELLSQLGENIQMPATMTHVAALIEEEFSKLISNSN